MRIKDIRKFRTHWKEKEGFIGFDENFIGFRKSEINGFYRIVNGTVHDIKSDLIPKLQNAQDEQAIYEFLQNAADSGSTDCAIIYDTEYFMVINNGNPFNLKDVEAILNSFQGTKADKSIKENCDKIGRYGIGFKLVHRLVGKSDGVNELIEKLSGPVIFSWFNKGQLTSLMNSSNVFEPDDKLSSGGSPWLFKIALTCFPSMPLEKVKDIDYNDKIIYPEGEYKTLPEFLNKHKEKIENLNLEGGSLFFLKFGDYKYAKLEESLNNIYSGIGYSLNTLNRLEKVIIQDKVITRKLIERIDIKIEPNEEAFKKIDPEFPECPIHMLFGYLKDDFTSLKNASNIYQYFPMRNESHGLSFLIHSTSFAKVTDRTKLDDQGEINIHTLQFLAKRLIDLLLNQFQDSDIERAKQIYQAIILSEKSEKQNSELIVKNFLLPLIGHFKNNVPTIHGNFSSYDRVVINDSHLTVDPSEFGINKFWFAWDNNESTTDLIEQSERKLSLKRYTLKNLLEEGQSAKVNAWVERLSLDDFERFIIELERNIPNNLNSLKFIRLEDGTLKSISELRESDIIIKFPKIAPIEGVLNTLNLNLSKYDFEELPGLKKKIADYAEYLKEDSEIKLYEKYIIKALPASDLKPLEKEKLFKTLKDFKYIGPETLTEKLKLFSNRQGEKCTLVSLVDPNLPRLESWLEPFCLIKEEFFDLLKSDGYLRSQSTIYNNIVVPFWENITSDLKEFEAEKFYQSVISYYTASSNPVSIKSKPIIHCQGNTWIKPDSKIFFHNQLIDFPRYDDLFEIFKLNEYYYPSKPILKYLNAEPFTLKECPVENLLGTGAFSKESILALLEFCRGKINLFDYGYIKESSDKFNFVADQSCIQYYDDNPELIRYVSEFCNEFLCFLPREFTGCKDQVLRGEHLYSKLIASSNNWQFQPEVLSRLLILLKDSGLKTVTKRFVNEIEEIKITADFDESEDNLSINWIRLIDNIYDANEINGLREKLVIDGIRLADLTWNNFVVLEDDEEIELSSILPRFGNTKVISKIVDKIQRISLIDQHKLYGLFQSKYNPTPQELFKITAEMLEEENRMLQNVDQLRLVLFIYKKGLLSSVGDIDVLSKNESWQSLSQSWYINSFGFIKENALLHDRYKNIGKKNIGSVHILTKPYFKRDTNSFICPHLSDTISGSPLIEFLELIKDLINKNAQSQVNWLDYYSDNIGFIPKRSVFAKERFVHADERLPKEVHDWVSKNTGNLMTLKALGVHNEESNIVRLRKHLLKLDDAYIFEGFFSNDDDVFLLLNSLALMELEEVEFDDKFGSIIKKITELIGSRNLDISEIHLPVATRLGENHLYFQMKNVDSAFLINVDFVSKLKNYVGNGYSEILKELIDSGINIIDNDCLSDTWVQQYTKPLKTTIPEVDFELLESSRQPCQLPHYEKWSDSTDSEFEIYYTDNLIPYQFSIVGFEDDFVFTYRKNGYYIDSENLILYTNGFDNLALGLSDLRDNDYISSNDLAFLLNGTNNGLAMYDAKEQEYLKEIANLKEKLNAIPSGDGPKRGQMDLESQRDWNHEARKILREHLETIPEFDCNGWDDNNIPSSVVKGVTYLGKPCIWIVRSAMSRDNQFHLTPYEWTLMEEPNVFLALRIDQTEIRIYGIDEDIRRIIYESNHTLNINFDSEQLSFDGINGLAKLLVKLNIWGSGLVFKNPNHTAGNSFKELERCKEGIINKLNEDAL